MPYWRYLSTVINRICPLLPQYEAIASRINRLDCLSEVRDRKRSRYRSVALRKCENDLDPRCSNVSTAKIMMAGERGSPGPEVASGNLNSCLRTSPAGVFALYSLSSSTPSACRGWSTTYQLKHVRNMTANSSVTHPPVHTATRGPGRQRSRWHLESWVPAASPIFYHGRPISLPDRRSFA
jgi:hypothetical protein